MGRAMNPNNPPLAPLEQIPATLQTIADYEKQARLHLNEQAWAYLQGGAMDQHSIQDNLQQFQKVQLIPRPLQDFSHAHTGIQLFGQKFVHPIFLAPIGHQQLFHPKAEADSALAAEVLGANLLLSHFTTTDLKQINADYSGKWLQLYWQGQPEHTLQLIRQAEQQGYKALVITVDAPHSGVRDQERKINFQLPPNMPHPHALTPNLPALKEGEHPLFQGLMKLAPTWEDIAWIVQHTPLPVVLKGIVHPQDALLAIQHGVKGLIISNHGGRVLDTCISPLTALQMIRKVVPQDFPLLYDGGIRRGTDVFKAIALGAQAVLIGRPYIYGLATAGALGVAHVIKILKEEFEITMALMGTATVSEINSSYIFQK